MLPEHQLRLTNYIEGFFTDQYIVHIAISKPVEQVIKLTITNTINSEEASIKLDILTALDISAMLLTAEKLTQKTSQQETSLYCAYHSSGDM